MTSRRTPTSRPTFRPHANRRRAVALLLVAATLFLSVLSACASDDASNAAIEPPATTAPIPMPNQAQSPPTEATSPEPEPTVPGPAEPSITEPEPTAPDAGVVAPGELELAENTVLAFVDSLGQGDLDAAAATIGPTSQQNANDAGGLVPLLQASTEGHGAWGRSADRAVTSVGIDPGLIVVVLEGTLQIEGMTERRVAAFPVRRAQSEGAWFIEPWAFDIGADLSTLQVVDPTVDTEEYAIVDPAQPFQVTVAVATGGTTWASFDGAVSSTELPGAAAATFAPSEGVPDLVVLLHQSGPELYATAFTTILSSQ